MSDKKEPTEQVKPPPPVGQAGMRFGSFGMPAEKPRDFGSSTRRLLRRLQHDQWIVSLAVLMAVAAVCMSVLLPKILGSATDVVVRAVFTRSSIDFSHLGRILGFGVGLLVAAWFLQYGMSYLLAGVVQRTMYRLRAE